MSLDAGSRIGHYEVVGSLGAGGMGEVYRARDTRIGRDVALKVLPALFTEDPDRLARFEREAQALGALNHPNIAQVYGFERDGDVRAIAMELVEGETLEAVIRNAGAPALPVSEALAIARQIADALEAAHDRGIVHRDLKPANVKVRDDGVVKVLDFGLAKAVHGEGSRPGEASPSQSPTLTARATELGMILGTAAYMSPEQAKGRAVDRRADVWAFGVVLYEMLAGRRAFKGDDVSETLASVLAREPDPSALPADTPPAVRRLLARCLEKDPRTRLRDIGDAMRQLDAELSAPAQADLPSSAPVPGPPAPTPRWRRWLPAGTLVLGLAAGAVLWAALSRAAAPQVVRFEYRPEADVQGGGAFSCLALSADGRTLVYLGRNAGTSGLRVRRLDQLTDVPLRGGENGSSPFLSPDGQWVGFVDLSSNFVIRKVSMLGGVAQRVVQAPSLVQGATWTADDTIVYAARGLGLFEVPSSGGEPRRLTDEAVGANDVWPAAIAGTRLVLFSRATLGMQPLLEGQLAVLDRDSRTVTTLGRPGSAPRYVQSGHVVYAEGAGSVMAAPFDVGRREFTGDSVPVVESVEVDSSGVAQLAVSDAGHAAYVVGGGLTGNRTLAWVDRAGRATTISDEARAYVYARLSPDERRLSLDIREENQDIWILDLARLTLSRLTFDTGPDNYAEWFPDSDRVVVGSRHQGKVNPDLAVYRVNGTGQPDWLTNTKEEAARVPNAVTPDGKFVIFRGPLGQGQDDLLTVPVEGDRKVETLLATEHSELNVALSPDGRWMAFQSTASGSPEIYVRPFPDVNGGQWQVSRAGGSKPVWSRDGRELFFVAADLRMMAVPVNARDTFASGTPEVLFDASAYYFGAPGRNYDVARSGRFVMIKEPETGGSSRAITVVLNWLEELKAIK